MVVTLHRGLTFVKPACVLAEIQHGASAKVPNAPAYTEIAKPRELQSAHRVADRATATHVPSAVVSLRGLGL